MNALFHILPAILCFALLIPSAYADEIPETTASPESTYETEWEPYTESLYLGDYEEPEEETQSEADAETETEGQTEPTEIPVIPEATDDSDMDSLLGQLVESQQNTEYATQIISGFCLFFVVCILCYFGYKFFRIFF